MLRALVQKSLYHQILTFSQSVVSFKSTQLYHVSVDHTSQEKKKKITSKIRVETFNNKYEKWMFACIFLKELVNSYKCSYSRVDLSSTCIFSFITVHMPSAYSLIVNVFFPYICLTECLWIFKQSRSSKRC